MSGYFITSTGTGIGKTFVTASLCHQLRQQGKPVQALKPIISGYDADDFTNDSAQILASLGLEPTGEAQAEISPWRFAAPLAPNMAAAREGRSLRLAEVIAFCQTPDSTLQTLLIEGVGGVMVPLNNEHTVLDWMVALRWPVIVVTGSYLGTISHTLTAVEVLRQRQLAIAAIVLSESEGSPVPMDETAATLQTFLPNTVPVVILPRITAGLSAWKYAPPLVKTCIK